MPTVGWRALCEQRRGLGITSLHSWFEGLLAQSEPIVLEHRPMIREGKAAEADITLIPSKARVTKQKKKKR